MDTDDRPSRGVPAHYLRRLFNDGRYWERARDGEFRIEIVKSQVCNPPPGGHPDGTLSQKVFYFNAENVRIAIVHQYRMPDGSIGGSGRPDPKYLLHDGVIYTYADDPSRHS